MFITDWDAVAGGIARKANFVVPEERDEKVLRKNLRIMTTEYLRRYADCLKSIRSEDLRSSGAVQMDGGDSLGRWIASRHDREHLLPHVQNALEAAKLMWNEVDFEPSLPQKFFEASLAIEFTSDAMLMVARDIFPDLGIQEHCDINMGSHMIDEDTYTEIVKDAKEGMSELAYKIMITANYLTHLLKEEPNYVPKAGYQPGPEPEPKT